MYQPARSELESAAKLARQHIAVTAVHNHLAGESLEVIYLHYHAQGVATELATRRLRSALDATR